ncbi:hypothetical protein MRB53_026795 [Persea americana]|uniref:Uncharacterized protein n=1 Tax=Persea americana TaxID=3435 RepID=A0ACC2LJ85_PERAE|nr:hypothetical protein MRB53_026795 [Persea americana]
MGRGKFKGKPTGRRHFSTPEEMRAGTSSRPRTFKQEEKAGDALVVVREGEAISSNWMEVVMGGKIKWSSHLRHVMKSDVNVAAKGKKRKGTQGVIEIENPNLVKQKNVKARDIDLEKTTELSRREREEIEKQKAHERYMRLQEQGKTEQARKDLERLSLIRQQRADAAKKREEEKAAKEQKKAEGRK